MSISCDVCGADSTANLILLQDAGVICSACKERQSLGVDNKPSVKQRPSLARLKIDVIIEKALALPVQDRIELLNLLLDLEIKE